MPKDFLKGTLDQYDVIVIGSGLAGLTSANILARAHFLVRGACCSPAFSPWR
jgi:succinate dehydrogenase/fumarate reductase flavoprotein subunit